MCNLQLMTVKREVPPSADLQVYLYFGAGGMRAPELPWKLFFPASDMYRWN